ncbi:MAG: TonB-dependent receptor plug domain-containing protein [Saprospiraceae bacterium]
MLIILVGCQHFLFAQQSGEILVHVECNGLSTQQVLDSIHVKYGTTFYSDQTNKLLSISVLRPCQDSNLQDFLENLLTGTSLGYIAYTPYLYIISDTALLDDIRFEAYFKSKSIIENNVTVDIETIGHRDSIARSGMARIRGVVTDGNTDSLISYAFIKFGDHVVTTTGDSGKIDVTLPIGIYSLIVESNIYQSYQKQVKIYGDGFIEVRLYENSVDLPELVIGGSAQRRLENATAGVAELSMKEVKRLPTLMGETDILKALLTLPGVSNTGEVGSGYNVRGGNIDQNLILQEGAFHLNPSHVLGLFSAFNPEAIKNVTLYKGYIPAQFGGRTSSVLDIKLKDPDFEHSSVFGGIGPISSKIFIDMPLVKNKLAFFAGSRFTYSDWVLGLIRDPNLKKSHAGFYDINFKLETKLGSAATLSLSMYNSSDQFNYAQEFGYGWSTLSFGLNYTQQVNQRVILTGSFIQSSNRNDFDDQQVLVKKYLKNGLDYLKTKWNVAWQASPAQTLNLGLEATRYKPLPQYFRAVSEQSTIEENVELSRGEEAAIYLNDEINLTKKINASLGFRFNMYRNFGAESVHQYAQGLPRIKANLIGEDIFKSNQTIKWYPGAEPRISAAYKINASSSVKLAYNHLVQFIHLVSNTAAATPVDLWLLSNSYIQPQQADNYSLGYFRNLRQNEWETSFEIYYKRLDHLIEYKDFAQLLRNPYIETDLFAVKGRSYGAELSIKRLKHNPTGYVSYTLSRSQRQSPGIYRDEVINEGGWYASNFDKPHNFNAVIDWQILKTMSFSSNFVYASGRPLTGPVADFYIGDGGVFLDYSQRNYLRIPDYHRLDVSLTVTRGAIRTRKNKGSITLSVYNLYARKNAFSVFYRKSNNQPLVAYKLAVLGTALPSLSYNFQF